MCGEWICVGGGGKVLCVCMSVCKRVHATWSDFHLKGILILKDSRPTLNESDHSRTNR